MLFSIRSSSKYSAVKDGELPQYDGELKLGGSSSSRPQKIQVSLSWPTLAVLLCSPILFILPSLIQYARSAPAAQVTNVGVACSSPSIRREWRTLDRAEKSSYINAVQCLSTLPSTLRENGTAYDDFPWVHKETAPSAHQSAPFLPWHRLYIHAYEKALKEQCSYGGVLPYWDWSQDASNFEGAPVWDSTFGFGGDGATNGVATVGGGRCVEDGPFAGLDAMFYDDKVQPHCLSRGFAKGAELNELTDLIKPDQLEDLMKNGNFEEFAPELERRAHTFISRSIKGDFSKYTGPYDPVFFLHHTNLDRLWSKWQKTHSTAAYGGKASMFADDAASVSDLLDIGGLYNKIPVTDVMETTSGMFCYQY